MIKDESPEEARERIALETLEQNDYQWDIHQKKWVKKIEKKGQLDSVTPLTGWDKLNGWPQ